MDSIEGHASPSSPSLPTTRTKRTSKACDHCRAKKLKCDGGTPCQRCRTLTNTCIYTAKDDKPNAPRKRRKKTGSINSLDHRIEKLEGLLSTLVKKLGGQVDSEELGSSHDFESDHDETDNATCSKSNTSASTHPGLGNDRGESLEEGDHSFIKYIGSQSTMSIFSEQGLSWICNKAKDPNCAKPVMEALSLMNTVIVTQREKYSIPVTERDVVPLPPKEEAYNLLEVFELSLPYTSYVVQRAELKEMLERYYATKDNSSPRQKLTHSEILILYMMLTNGASYRVQEASTRGDTHAVLCYQQSEMQYFNSAFFYYQKLSVLSESINGLKALLLLALYGDMTMIPDVDYVIGSFAIRLAQSLGLHRKEMVNSYPFEEATRRRKLWFVCYMLDRNLCLHTGKPPIIHDDDISSIDIDFVPDYHQIKIDTAEKLHIDVSDLDLDNNLNHCDAFYFVLKGDDKYRGQHVVEKASLKIAKITSKSYSKLFSATALVGKTRSQMMAVIGELNRELKMIKNSLPVSMRPGYPINLPKNSDTYQFDYNLIVRMQMAYNLISMVINRIALSMHWGDFQVEAKSPGQNSSFPQLLKDQLPIEREYSMICIDSCTEIINTSKSIIYKDFNLWFTTLFPFFSATITAVTFCMDNPTHPDTRKIIEGLIHSISHAFNDCYPKNRCDLINFIKIAGMNLCMGVFIKISVNIYNNLNPYNPITENNDELSKGLCDTENLLTTITKEYKKQLENKPNDKISVTLSDVSIAETISKIYARIPSPGTTPGEAMQLGKSAASEGTSPIYSSWSGTLPETKLPNQSNSALASNSKMDTSSLLNSSIKSGDLGYPTPTAIYNKVSPSFSKIPTNYSNSGPLAVPPSIEDVLGTSDFSINWENFSHNLFNFPVSFTGEFDSSQGQNHGQDQNQEDGEHGNGSQYLL